MMPEPSAPPSRIRARIRIILVSVVAMTLLPLLLLISRQAKLIYFPRPYGGTTVADWQNTTHGRMVDFTTSEGRQRAFLQGNLTSPRNLWIVCAGNGSVALDWSDWLAAQAPREDAYLLVDFPGYGDCEGSPTPERIRENVVSALPATARSLGWPEQAYPQRLRFLGHSLGAAACLAGAVPLDIQRGVLIAPFTSTMAMSRVMTGLPLGSLVWHRFDNAARLGELATRGPGKIIILHGSEDEAIPVEMSRELAASRKDLVLLREIPGGRHNTIPLTHAAEVANAMEQAGRAAD